MLLSLAEWEWERDTIRDRIRAGVDRAAAEGRTGGRPPALSSEKVEAVKSFLGNGGSVSAAARTFGVSRPTVRAISRSRTPCPLWHRSVLCRLNNRYLDLGRQRQGQGRPYTDREGVSRHHLQSQVPARQQADTLPRTQDRTPPQQSRKHLPAQRDGQPAMVLLEASGGLELPLVTAWNTWPIAQGLMGPLLV